jgi:hypothetical protein
VIIDRITPDAQERYRSVEGILLPSTKYSRPDLANVERKSPKFMDTFLGYKCGKTGKLQAKIKGKCVFCGKKGHQMSESWHKETEGRIREKPKKQALLTLS